MPPNSWNRIQMQNTLFKEHFCAKLTHPEGELSAPSLGASFSNSLLGFLPMDTLDLLHPNCCHVGRPGPRQKPTCTSGSTLHSRPTGVTGATEVSGVLWGAEDPELPAAKCTGPAAALTSSPPGRFMDDRSKTESSREFVSTFHLFC